MMKVYELASTLNIESIKRNMKPVVCISSSEVFPTLSMAALITNVGTYTLTKALTKGDGHACGKRYKFITLDEYWHLLEIQKRNEPKLVRQVDVKQLDKPKKVYYFQQTRFGIPITESDAIVGHSKIDVESRIDLAVRAAEGEGVIEILFDARCIPSLDELIDQVMLCHKALVALHDR